MLQAPAERFVADVSILVSTVMLMAVYEINCSCRLFVFLCCLYVRKVLSINHFTPNGHYMDRTAQLTSRRFILYMYSTNIRNGYFKHAAYSRFFLLQNAVYFIMLPFLVPVLFAF